MLKNLLSIPKWMFLLLTFILLSLSFLWNWLNFAVPSAPAKWTARVGSSSTVYMQTSAGVDSHKVYVTSEEIQEISGGNSSDTNYLTAINADSGSVIWRFNLPIYDLTPPVVADGIIYLGRCIAIDADKGTLLWQTSVNDYDTRAAAPPLVADGLVYFGTRRAHEETSPDTFLYAADARTGKIVWQIKVESGVSTYSIDSGTLYFGNFSSRLILGVPKYLRAVDSKTGKELWTFMTTEELSHPPVFANSNIYFTAQDYRMGDTLYALDKATGKQLWQFHSGKASLSAPTITNSELYIGVNEQREECIDNCGPSPDYKDFLYKLNASNGDVISSMRVRASITGEPILLGNTLYSVDFHGDLYSRNSIDGKVQWRLESRSYTGVSPVVSANTIYLPSWYDHNLYAVSLPPVPITKSPSP